MTGKQFFSTLQKQKDGEGVAYILLGNGVDTPELDFGNPQPKKKEKKITAMYLLDPCAITEKFDDNKNEIVSYEYKTKTGSITYDAKNVIRCARIDPANPLKCESLIESGRKNISTGIQLDDYQANVLRNGGSIKGILKFKDQTLTREKIDDLKDQYKEQYAGAKKSGTPLFLGGDAEYIPVGLTPEEMGFINSKNCNLNDICILTGVPKSILGNFDEIKYDNAEASIKIFLKEVITPQARELAEAFNWSIIPEDMDLDFVPFVDEEKESINKMLEVGNTSYCLSTNEKRRFLSKVSGQELNDVEGGDEILAPFSLAPLSNVSEEPETTPEETPEEKNRIKSPACRKEDETKKECIARKIPELVAEGYDQEQAVAIAESLCSKKCKCCDIKSFKPLVKDEMKINYAESMNKYIDKRALQLKDGVISFADQQEKRVMKQLGFTKKSKIDIELSGMIDGELALAIKFITPYLEEFINDSGNGALQLLGIDSTLQVTDRMKKVIEKRAKYYAKTTTKTTFDELKNSLNEGVENDETIAELTGRVNKVFKNYKVDRAEMIARTEATNANNDGLLEAYKQSGVVSHKEWIAVLDSCPECQAVNGDVVEMNSNFANGLTYPPAHPNCRCVIGPVLEGEE